MSSTEFLNSRNKAIQQYDAAFHLLNVTFPLVKDPKLLIGVLHNLSQAFEHSIEAVLSYERQLRLIPPYHNNFKSKFNLFRYKCVQRNKISPHHINLYLQLQELIELQKKCPMEFQRGNKYVLCSKDYHIKSLSIKEIKFFLQQTKEFLEKTDQILHLK